MLNLSWQHFILLSEAQYWQYAEHIILCIKFVIDFQQHTVSITCNIFHFFFFLVRIVFQTYGIRSMMIVLYHQIKIPIGF